MPNTETLPLRIEPANAAHWPDLERLFESRGGPHACWCSVWRPLSSKERNDKVVKKATLKARVCDGPAIGLLGYLGEEPIAWCSVGPRDSFRRLLDQQDETGTECIWSIVCFFVVRKHRGKGYTDTLIQAAMDYATAHGADLVEAYPVAPDAPSYRFMGFTPPFERAGFKPAGQAGTRRTVMRKSIK